MARGKKLGLATPAQIIWGVVILCLGIVVGKAIIDINSYQPPSSAPAKR